MGPPSPRGLATCSARNSIGSAPVKRRIALRRTGVVIALLLAVAGAGAVLQPDRLIDLDYARQRIAAGLSKATLQVDDHRWTYAHAAGNAVDAPLIVMVHGFTGSKENWYPLADALAGRYAVAIPDLPGWGETQRVGGADYGYLAQAARVERFIETLKARQPREVVLLGHSMGGGIAALVAARRPDLVARVGLLDAAGVRFADNRFGREVLAGRNPFAVNDVDTLERYVDTVFFDASAKPWVPWPASRAYIARRVRDAGFEQGVLDGIGRGPERFLPGDAAPRIRQPALLLWCRQDAVIDASALDLYGARMPHASRVLLDGCGHMSLMEQPAAVARAVNALIERGASR